jgi:hypothetical protein
MPWTTRDELGPTYRQLTDVQVAALRWGHELAAGLRGCARGHSNLRPIRATSTRRTGVADQDHLGERTPQHRRRDGPMVSSVVMPDAPDSSALRPGRNAADLAPPRQPQDPASGKR